MPPAGSIKWVRDGSSLANTRVGIVSHTVLTTEVVSCCFCCQIEVQIEVDF